MIVLFVLLAPCREAGARHWQKRAVSAKVTVKEWDKVRCTKVCIIVSPLFQLEHDSN